MFITEAVFISKQLKEYRFKALLEISDKFSSKLNYSSYIILQCWFNILENNITVMYDFGKHSGWIVLFESR